MKSTLSQDKKKAYRSIGHDLNPVVTIAGNGLSDNVVMEIERALNDHELIKVKIAVGGPSDRKAIIEEMCKLTQSELVQAIGKVALIFKKADRPDPKKSNLLR